MFELITAEILRFEGTINQYGGDGLMALFGAPIAHEDAPRRAVHAVLGIQLEYTPTLERECGLKLQVRIGINTGTVMVGRIETDLHMNTPRLEIPSIRLRDCNRWDGLAAC